MVFRIVKSIDKIKNAKQTSLGEFNPVCLWRRHRPLGHDSFTIPRLYVLKMISCRVQQSGKPAIYSSEPLLSMVFGCLVRIAETVRLCPKYSQPRKLARDLPWKINMLNPTMEVWKILFLFNWVKFLGSIP